MASITLPMGLFIKTTGHDISKSESDDLDNSITVVPLWFLLHQLALINRQDALAHFHLAVSHYLLIRSDDSYILHVAI